MSVANPSNTRRIEQIGSRERKEFYYVDLVENTRTLLVDSPLLSYGTSNRPYVHWINDDYFIASSNDPLYTCGDEITHRLYNKTTPIMNISETNETHALLVNETTIIGNQIVLVYSDGGTLNEWGSQKTMLISDKQIC